MSQALHHPLIALPRSRQTTIRRTRKLRDPALAKAWVQIAFIIAVEAALIVWLAIS